MKKQSIENRKFLRISDVAKLTTLSKSHLYNLIRNGAFPKPIKLTENTSVWCQEAVNEWIEQRIHESNGAA